jgi:hypothetical protein
MKSNVISLACSRPDTLDLARRRAIDHLMTLRAVAVDEGNGQAIAYAEMAVELVSKFQG